MKIQVFIAALLLTALSYAADKTSDAVLLRDTKDYVEAIERVGKLSIDDQIDVWQTFLSDHPQSMFRKEIEQNIELLQSLTQKKSGKKGDERDAELYLKALEYSKKLSIPDQILLWQQFILENPNSIYKSEAETRLYKLQRTGGQPAVKPTAPTSQITPVLPTAASTQKPTATTIGVVRDIKDPDRALLLASLPGLIVPGMGHWYTEDYVIAGVLTGIRVAGIGAAIPGIINSEYVWIYIGGGLALLSYIIDIADAPYSAIRYNNRASALNMNSSSYLASAHLRGTTIPVFAYSVAF